MDQNIAGNIEQHFAGNLNPNFAGNIDKTLGGIIYQKHVLVVMFCNVSVCGKCWCAEGESCRATQITIAKMLSGIYNNK